MDGLWRCSVASEEKTGAQDFKIEMRHRSEMSHSKKNHDGEHGIREVLEGDEVEACAMEICADADVDVTGAMAMAEAAQ